MRWSVKTFFFFFEVATTAKMALSKTLVKIRAEILVYSFTLFVYPAMFVLAFLSTIYRILFRANKVENSITGSVAVVSRQQQQLSQKACHG